MRFNPIPLITLLLLLSISSWSQDASSFNILLRSGAVNPGKNITTENLNRFNNAASRSDGKSFLIIQFEKIPDAAQRQQLRQAGIELLDFIPGYAYTATVSGSLDETALNASKARAIIQPTAMQKMQPELAKGNFPVWAVKSSGTVDVWISFPRTFLLETLTK